jgi:hypothetical protein
MMFVSPLRRTVQLVGLVSLILSAPGAARAADAPMGSYARQYADFTLKAMDRIQANLPEQERVADIVAKRHIAGGVIGFVSNGSGLQQELSGRSGGFMHDQFDHPWEKVRDPEEDKQNVAIVSWDRSTGGKEMAQLQKLHDAGTYIIGFGPGMLPEVSAEKPLCDAFFDTGMDELDGQVTLPDGSKAGRGNFMVNMLNGWAFTGELVAALTRQGKMPVMFKSMMFPDGTAWNQKYRKSLQFHDDFQIAPIPAGKLTTEYFDSLRADIKRFEDTQGAGVAKAAGAIVAEAKAGHKTIVATEGHAPWTFVGRYEDGKWATLVDLEAVPAQVKKYAETPDGALVLRLGYSGLEQDMAEQFLQKKQRVLLISTPTPDPKLAPPPQIPILIDMGWLYGDANVSIPGYPIRILAPSGVLQLLAYESVNVEVLAHLPADAAPQ